MLNNNRSIDSHNQKRKTEWGLETGVDGRQHSRLVLLKELHNYRRLTHNGFNFYLSTIDTKHPKFMRTTERGFERWRMRFNVFSNGFFSEWLPNTVCHLGELHVYYDLMSDRSHPWCQDFTFYYDDRTVDSEVITGRYQQMEMAFRDSLLGSGQRMKSLLVLPISRHEFVSENKDLEEFLERQEVMLSSLEELKKQMAKTFNQTISYQSLTKSFCNSLSTQPFGRSLSTGPTSAHI